MQELSICGGQLMIRYDGDVVYSESGSGIKATSRMLFNEAQEQQLKQLPEMNFPSEAIMESSTLLKT